MVVVSLSSSLAYFSRSLKITTVLVDDDNFPHIHCGDFLRYRTPVQVRALSEGAERIRIAYELR